MTFTAGKYEGTEAADVPTEDLHWIFWRSRPVPTDRVIAMDEIERRQDRKRQHERTAN
jgi:hypothetical protein